MNNLDFSQLFKEFYSTILSWATTAGIRLLVAVFLLFVSFKIVNLLAKRIAVSYQKGKIDKTIAKTFAYVFKFGMKIIIGVSLVGYVGIDTGGFAAIITSAGVCIGLAVNGAVANIAGGIILLITRPFKVDDYIEAQGYEGTVADIHILSTKLITIDNKVVYIPNGTLSSGTVLNYSEKDDRRIDLVFIISRDNDLSRAKSILSDVCLSHKDVLKDPPPFVRMAEQGEGDLRIAVKAWVKNDSYWTVYYDLLEEAKAALDAAGMTVPGRRLDVRVEKSEG